jgi:DNA-binding MarR family transcriptional regulator
MLELGLLALGDLGALEGRDLRDHPDVSRVAAVGLGSRASGAAVSELIDETVRLAGRARAATGRERGPGELSGSGRVVLRWLARFEPRTVPQVARAHSFSRQHAQALVNPLAEKGLVEFVDNPAHKRSRLVRLTGAGRDHVDRLARQESWLLKRLRPALTDEDLGAATRVLRMVGEALDS